MVERDGSFSRVGVVGEVRRDLGERREEEVERREFAEERGGDNCSGVWYGEEEGSWYTMEGREVRSWWSMICSDKEASDELSVVRPEYVEELSERKSKKL